MCSWCVKPSQELGSHNINIIKSNYQNTNIHNLTAGLRISMYLLSISI